MSERKISTPAEFFDAYGLAFSVERIPARSDGPTDAWAKDASHWRYTFTRAGRTISGEYSQGSAHVVPSGKRVRNKYDDGWAPEMVPRTPAGPDVLACLLSDARDFLYGPVRFEDWASDLGYDTDSRKTEAIFRACQDQAANLVRLLGKPAHEIAADVESALENW